MAKIIRSKRESTYAYYHKGILKKRIVVFIICLAGVTGAYFTYGISLLLCLSLFSLKRDRSYEKILDAGESGEMFTEMVLKKLPRSYYVVSDVVLERKNGTSQMDHVVVGRNGVFIVETKNHRGTITGNDEDVKVLQEKQLKGRKVKKTFYNPTKQVSGHVRTVRRMMEDTGYGGTAIIGIVFFSNPDAKVYLTSNIVPVFSARTKGAKRLRSYIKNRKSNGYLKPGEQKDLAELFSGKQEPNNFQ